MQLLPVAAVVIVIVIPAMKGIKRAGKAAGTQQNRGR